MSRSKEYFASVPLDALKENEVAAPIPEYQKIVKEKLGITSEILEGIEDHILSELELAHKKIYASPDFEVQKVGIEGCLRVASDIIIANEAVNHRGINKASKYVLDQQLNNRYSPENSPISVLKAVTMKYVLDWEQKRQEVSNKDPKMIKELRQALDAANWRLDKRAMNELEILSTPFEPAIPK